jgi:PAS domain S-box-containing protein
MTMTLRRRILLTVAPLVLLLAGLGTAGAGLVLRLGRLSDAILRENHDSVRAMDRLREGVFRVDRSFLTGSRAEYDAGWAEVDRQLAVEKGIITIFPDEPILVGELDAALTKYRVRPEQFAELTAVDRASLSVGRDAVLGRAAAVRDLNEAEMYAASARANNSARHSVVGLGVGLAASLALAFLAAWWLVRSIVAPIEAVTAAAAAIGGGQLHLVVPAVSRDEVGRLAEAFNAMAEKLRAYRRANTERLGRAQQSAQATIDSFPDPVVVLDTLGRVETANPAAQALLGVRPTADGETPAPWPPPESLRAAVRDALEAQRPTLTETFAQAVTFYQGGSERVYLPQVRPIRDPAGETLGAAVVLSDVTRYQLLDRLKSDWVATVSHELKTPLTSVRLAVHVLLEELVGPLEVKQVELLLEARENTERLLKLIEHLLALARLEKGREPLDLRPTDPATLLQAAAESSGARAEDRRITLAVIVASDLPTVSVDATRFGQALNNLVENALTYTEPGGRVTLSAEANPGGVTLTVRDTGVGIPAADLPHVFDRFFRVAGRTQPPGTGLGLAIVHEVVTAHTGTVTCASEPGVGTTFRITMPATLGTPS